MIGCGVGYVVCVINNVFGSSLFKTRDDRVRARGSPALPEQADREGASDFGSTKKCVLSAFTGHRDSGWAVLPQFLLKMSA